MKLFKLISFAAFYLKEVIVSNFKVAFDVLTQKHVLYLRLITLRRVARLLRAILFLLLGRLLIRDVGLRTHLHFLDCRLVYALFGRLLLVVGDGLLGVGAFGEIFFFGLVRLCFSVVLD